MKTPQHVYFVEFPVIAGHAAVVARTPCKAHQLTRIVFDDKREIRGFVSAENPLPLTLTNGHRGATAVRFAKRLNV
jgi:hypothetical protein